MRKPLNLKLTVALLLLLPLFGAAQETAPQLKSIDLEWEPVEKASGYEVRLMPAKGGKSLKFFTEQSKLLQDVPVGTYKLQIRSRSEEEDVFGPWSESTTVDVVALEIVPTAPVDQAVISAMDTNKYTVEFEWAPVDQVKIYTIKVWTDKRKDKPWVFTTKKSKAKLDVPPGDVYYWQVLFESVSGISYAQAPTTFKFTLLGAKLTKPEIGPGLLEWQESPGAKIYKAKLLYRFIDETEWKVTGQTDTANKIWALEKLKPGAYKLQVIATAPRRTDSDIAELEFLVKPSDAELRQAMARP